MIYAITLTALFSSVAYLVFKARESQPFETESDGFVLILAPASRHRVEMAELRKQNAQNRELLKTHWI
jgi:hypothetical protein